MMPYDAFLGIGRRADHRDRRGVGQELFQFLIGRILVGHPPILCRNARLTLHRPERAALPHQIKHRRHRQHDPFDDELAARGVRQHPQDDARRQQRQSPVRPEPRTARRRCGHRAAAARTEAATHIRYSVSAATFARIASCVKLLLAAMIATMTAYTTMAMYGVWKRGWMRAIAAGSTPSRANANSARGLPSMSPET